MNQANDQMKGFEGDRLFLGQNPAPGATLAYRLKADAKDVKITIKDASGSDGARDLTGDAMRDRNKAGLNIVKWDLRVQPLRPLPPPPGAPAGGGRRRWRRWRFRRRRQQRPVRAAGHLQGHAECRTAATRRRSMSTVKGDPEITITDADRRMWFDTARELHSCRRRRTTWPRWCRTRLRRCRCCSSRRAARTLSPNAKQQLDAVVKEFEAVRRRLGLGQQGGGGGGFGGNTENLRGRFGQLKGQSWRRPRRRPTRR